MKYKINWDALGIGTSVACAIHCALLPLFLSSLPLLGINIIDNIFFEVGMILLALCIGTLSLYHAYKKYHHNRLPFLLFFTGFTFLVLKEFFIQIETWLLIPAVILIITAHILNYRYYRTDKPAHSNDGDH